MIILKFYLLFKLWSFWKNVLQKWANEILGKHSAMYRKVVRPVCVFSLHFRAQVWNFFKSIIRTQKIKFGWNPKILPPNVYFTEQTAVVIGQKKILEFHFPIAHWKGHVLQTKLYKKTIHLFFVFQKLLRFINYWNQEVHVVFLPKKKQKLNVFVT